MKRFANQLELKDGRSRFWQLHVDLVRRTEFRRAECGKPTVCDMQSAQANGRVGLAVYLKPILGRGGGGRLEIVARPGLNR